jgi:hypothetical protein
VFGGRIMTKRRILIGRPREDGVRKRKSKAKTEGQLGDPKWRWDCGVGEGMGRAAGMRPDTRVVDRGKRWIDEGCRSDTKNNEDKQ